MTRTPKISPRRALRLFSRWAPLLALLVLWACGGGSEEAVLPDPPPAAAATPAPAIAVDTGEAEAVLRLLELRGSGEAIPEAAWQELFATTGYRRLAEREASMGRSFEESDFRDFVLSDALAEAAPDLASTLAQWEAVDFGTLAGQILPYLPADATLEATVYPAIKPQGNSFVFDLSGDPAIFLYLDPEVPPEKFANTVLHELHHIGFGTTCPPPEAETRIEELPEGAQSALRWLGAFGEGFAMLAAAGGPDVHPHATSPEADRERWDGDVARFDEDRQKVERFLADLVEGRLDRDQEIATARSFYGVQGPWYTVGWRMAVTIEEQLGRDELIAAFCDPRRLLPAYQEAAASAGAARSGWSPELIAALGGDEPPGA